MVISTCFSLQQPLPEVFIPPQVSLNLPKFRPVPQYSSAKMWRAALILAYLRACQR